MLAALIRRAHARAFFYDYESLTHPLTIFFRATPLG
jgi:hypothetical protein